MLISNNIQIILLKCFIFFFISKKPKYVNVINQDSIGWIRDTSIIGIKY